jgi:putative DNA methylase
VLDSIGLTEGTGTSIVVARGSATSQPWPEAALDAVITDPPYYDNVPYADISDFFYVWLKRTVGHLYLEHFGGQGTPKKQEAVADATRHGGDKRKANHAYEQMMAQSLAEAHRVLKSGGTLAVVYAHKTTLGWSTLVDAFRYAGFTVAEAWPLDTENKSRLRAMESAALASSIFLVGRKREGKATGFYETDVQPELEVIVRERVETLWDQGISGADLVIACVGAGLRAFTRFARVEYANGEEVPAERFLTEVETVVLDSILARLSKEAGGNGGRYSLAGVDPATRFYTLWRYTYRSAELDAGEAIVFANGTHVELDGPNGLSSGSRALVEKKKGKYRLRDFAERGDDDKLGMPADDAQPAPLIDALHRTLWLMEHRPRQLGEFFREAQPNRDQMRLVAQALAGPALKGGELGDISPTVEMAALAKLTSNWRSVVEDNVFTPDEQADRKRGQRKLFE